MKTPSSTGSINFQYSRSNHILNIRNGEEAFLISTLNMTESFIRSHGHKIYHELTEHISIEGDPKKLSQVLVNIIKNAVEAMDESGEITVKLHSRNEYAFFSIIDTGVGISQEHIIKLGDPFYSTKEKGTGLGLMISFRIIEAMKGKIEVQSEKGKGTVFTIILPCKSIK
jgi:two-component system sporulation sensor kinase B